MIDLNALALFAKVVEAKSFSEGARRLKMPVSTVSRRIADFEDDLGMRLLERSTRNVRVTDIGAEVLEYAQRATELVDAVNNIVSYQSTNVAGLIRLSAPPSISDSMLAPMIGAFQASYPEVRVEILVTDRWVDQIAEGVDLTFRLGVMKDSSLVARKILTYRHQLVASPAYLERVAMPQSPRDLLDHRLITFSHWKSGSSWTFGNVDGNGREALHFKPFLAMNDFAGIAASLLSGTGIGDLPPIVQPDLVRTGRLVEVMPQWRLPTFDLSIVHLGNRHMPRHVRLFKEFAVEMAPSIFPVLPV